MNTKMRKILGKSRSAVTAARSALVAAMAMGAWAGAAQAENVARTVSADGLLED